MIDPIPEQVYLDAALAFRAAVESAYAAGYGRGRDDEAAGLDLPAWAAPEPQPATPATPAQDAPADPGPDTSTPEPAQTITRAADHRCGRRDQPHAAHRFQSAFGVIDCPGAS